MIDCVVTVLLAVVYSDYTVTVQSLCLAGDWWNRSFAVIPRERQTHLALVQAERLGIIKYLAFLYLLLISWIAIIYSTALTWYCNATMNLCFARSECQQNSNFPELLFLNCLTPKFLWILNYMVYSNFHQNCSIKQQVIYWKYTQLS